MRGDTSYDTSPPSVRFANRRSRRTDDRAALPRQVGSTRAGIPRTTREQERPEKRATSSPGPRVPTRSNYAPRRRTAPTGAAAHFLRCRIRLLIRRFLRPTLRRPLPRRRLAMPSPQGASMTRRSGTEARFSRCETTDHNRHAFRAQGLPGRRSWTPGPRGEGDWSGGMVGSFRAITHRDRQPERTS